jgi:hypothetical protein
MRKPFKKQHGTGTEAFWKFPPELMLAFLVDFVALLIIFSLELVLFLDQSTAKKWVDVYRRRPESKR